MEQNDNEAKPECNDVCDDGNDVIMNNEACIVKLKDTDEGNDDIKMKRTFTPKKDIKENAGTDVDDEEEYSVSMEDNEKECNGKTPGKTGTPSDKGNEVDLKFEGDSPSTIINIFETPSLNRSRSKFRKSTELSLHSSKWSYNWTDISDVFSENSYGYHIWISFIILFIFDCIPQLLFDFHKTWGIILQNIFITPGVLLSPFYIIRATLRKNESPFPRILIPVISYLIIQNGFELILIYYTDNAPLPFRVVWYSLIWVIITPIATYFAFKNVDIREYISAWISVSYLLVLFYTCIGFIFSYYYFKFNPIFTKSSSAALQSLSLGIFYIMCILMRTYARDWIEYSQNLAGIIDKNSEKDGRKLRRFVAPITYQFLTDFVQNFYELVVLPESEGISGAIILLTLDLFSLFYRCILIFPQNRHNINTYLDRNPYNLPKWLINKLRVLPDNETGTFKEGLEFGMQSLALTLSNMAGIIVITTLYYGRNNELFNISQLSVEQLGYSYVAALIELSVTFSIMIFIHFYVWGELKLCHPMYTAMLYIKHNYGYIITLTATGSMFGFFVLGKHWNAIYFIIKWLEN